jgi:2-octaprenyl-6-methoxyphenol hydroxylase
MASNNSFDVIIAGGGLVGLTLGHALAAGGLSTLVVDRESPAVAAADAFDGRASAIAWGSARALQALGLWDLVAPQACPILDIRVSDGPSRLFLHYDHRDVGDRPLGFILENRFLRRALLARLPESPRLTLNAPAEVERIESSDASVTARLGDGRTIVASLVVAADGRNSPLREAAGIGVVTWPYAQTGIVATVAHERPHRNVAHERFLPAGPFALLPLPGTPEAPHRSSIVWTERAELAEHVLGLDDDGFNAAMTRRFGDTSGALRILGRRWAYPLSLMHAERYVDRRLALVGDAAHGIHPIAGQGLNLGLRDVAALADVLVDARRLGLDIGQADVLERYQRWRRFDAMALIAVTDGLNRLFTNDLAPVRFVRDLGLATVDALPALKRVFMHHAMGTLGILPRLLRGETIESPLRLPVGMRFQERVDRLLDRGRHAVRTTQARHGARQTFDLDRPTFLEIEQQRGLHARGQTLGETQGLVHGLGGQGDTLGAGDRDGLGDRTAQQFPGLRIP